jgi:hypothetical protein
MILQDMDVLFNVLGGLQARWVVQNIYVYMGKGTRSVQLLH